MSMLCRSFAFCGGNGEGIGKNVDLSMAFNVVLGVPQDGLDEGMINGNVSGSWPFRNLQNEFLNFLSIKLPGSLFVGEEVL